MCTGPRHGSEADGPAVCGDGGEYSAQAGRPGAVGGETRQPHGNTTSTGSKNCKCNGVNHPYDS